MRLPGEGVSDRAVLAGSVLVPLSAGEPDSSWRSGEGEGTNHPTAYPSCYRHCCALSSSAWQSVAKTSLTFALRLNLFQSLLTVLRADPHHGAGCRARIAAAGLMEWDECTQPCRGLRSFPQTPASLSIPRSSQDPGLEDAGVTLFAVLQLSSVSLCILLSCRLCNVGQKQLGLSVVLREEPFCDWRLL